MALLCTFVYILLAPNCTIQHVGNGSIGYENNNKITPINTLHVVPEGTKLVFSCNKGFVPSMPTDLWCQESGLSSFPHCAGNSKQIKILPATVRTFNEYVSSF